MSVIIYVIILLTNVSNNMSNICEFGNNIFDVSNNKKMILGNFDLFSKNHFFLPLGAKTPKKWEKKMTPPHFRMTSTIETTICNFVDLGNENFGKKYHYKWFFGDFGFYALFAFAT